MNHFSVKVLLFVSFLSCEREVKYDDSNLINFLSEEFGFSPQIEKNMIIIVLQNEECICTDENIKFAIDILNSKKYSTFNKVLILKSNRHKILTDTRFNSEEVIVFVNSESKLEKYGLYLATDRLFLYVKDSLTSYDLHVEKPKNVRGKVL